MTEYMRISDPRITVYTLYNNTYAYVIYGLHSSMPAIELTHSLQMGRMSSQKYLFAYFLPFVRLLQTRQ